MDINKHRFYLVRILKEIYQDIELANSLGFKGGTALMFFYGLPRFSVDLDFNLLHPGKDKLVYEKVRKIILKYGTIHDEALKHLGPIVVLDYGVGERKLKIEISNSVFDNHYEIKNLLGITMKVMVKSDMFAHKLCAMLDRPSFTNRDIFDNWFFIKDHTPLNKDLVESRMNKPLSDYLQECIDILESISDKGILQGMGELLEEEIKQFVRTKLRVETIELLKFYKEYPILT